MGQVAKPNGGLASMPAVQSGFAMGTMQQQQQVLTLAPPPTPDYLPQRRLCRGWELWHSLVTPPPMQFQSSLPPPPPTFPPPKKRFFCFFLFYFENNLYDEPCWNSITAYYQQEFLWFRVYCIIAVASQKLTWFWGCTNLLPYTTNVAVASGMQ
jgi:hypothetical protein